VKPLTIRIAFLAVAALCTSGAAYAARVGVGIYVAPAPYYYPVAPVPYYYAPAYPPAVVVPAEPDNYVEQGQPSAGPAQSNGSWYYCDASKTYYPYVKQCASGWREVPAQSPSN
jgi:hypothetical protein